MKSTQQEIESAISELKDAMLENVQISLQENDVKIKKTASHYRLLKAKETVHSLELN